MNHADILKLVKEARISTRNILNGDGETIYMGHLTRFAELVAQHEREAGKLEAIQACRECYSPDDTAADWDEKMVDMQRGILMQQRIRARGTK